MEERMTRENQRRIKTEKIVELVYIAYKKISYLQYMKCKGTKRNGEECKLLAINDTEYCRHHQHTPIVVKVRCNAIANNRQQCKHYTIKGLKCHQHLDKFQHLKVVESKLPGAKLGLFATKPIVRGQDTVEYSCPQIVTYDDDYGDDYSLQVRRNPPTFIDSRATNNEVGRFANARLRRLNQGANNAQLNYNARTKKAFIRATKPIPVNEEITVPYGAQYWQRVNARGN